VIAYGRGGALETVIGVSSENPPQESTGIFFPEDKADSLVHAIRSFESQEHRFDPHFIRSSVQCFDESQFKIRMPEFINACLAQHGDAKASLPTRGPFLEASLAHGVR
jgi:hypothetical protein